jgi:hypothetical protein
MRVCINVRGVGTNVLNVEVTSHEIKIRGSETQKDVEKRVSRNKQVEPFVFPVFPCFVSSKPVFVSLPHELCALH